MILLSGLVLAGATLYILAPLLGWGVSPAFETETAARGRQEELLARRRELLGGIKDLDLEFEVGKLTREDYDQIRERLSQQAVEIYRELDRYDRA
ncbi:MAG TPA: hypothetical protein VGK94_12180 [Candidatus Polarisedimenticolia bacterium]|jgi:hypothetical protein